MEYQYYIKEKNLDKHPNPISIDKLEVILEQIKNCICNIECIIEGHGTGFFCRIPFPDFFNIKPVLMTNNHVLNKDDIAEGNIIEFTLNKEKIRKKIKITDKRKVYTNEKYDITIIELNPKEDSIDENSFLDVDTKIYCDNPNYEFRNKDIYIIGNIEDYTYGKIKSIDENGITIEHLCSTLPGMSGSPMINLNNFRVIGIHKGSHPKKEFNLGTFLREPLKQFYSLMNKSFEVKHTSKIDKIFQSEEFNNERMQLFLSKFENDKNLYKILEELKNIQWGIIEGAKLLPRMLDPRGNKYEGWNVGKKIKGGFEYYPPAGWIGFGLNVKLKFDNGDDSWIENNNSNWCIAYHGFGRGRYSNEVKKIIGIICNHGFMAGASQFHSECEDIYHPGQKVGKGVYFSQNIAVAENYAGTINICDEDYIIVLMVRIKSSSIRCCEDAPEYWVTNGNCDEVRPYRILVKKYD